MEDNSEANNNDNNGVGNNHPVVASSLSSAKHVVLDDETSASLAALTAQFLGRRPWVNGSESFKTAIKKGLVPKISELGKPIDGFTPPKLPPVDTLEGLIGECGVPFEKQLTESDVKRSLGRLLMARELVKKFVKPLMSEEERRSLKHGKEIQVTAYDSKGIEYRMKFKVWASKKHVLTLGWNEFRIDNNFKALHDWVTMWAFRHKETEKLCFVIIAITFQINNLIRPPQKE